MSTQKEFGSEPTDFNQEPRKVFLNLLLWNVKIIETHIYMQRNSSAALRALMGLIDSLDQKSKKDLGERYDQLKEVSEGKSPLYDGMLEEAFSEILSYLHEGYLKEMRFATPRYPSSKIEVPQF